MKDGPENPARRKFMIGLGAAAATAATGGALYLKERSDRKKKGESEAPEKIEMIDVPVSLRGRMLNDLFTHYTGITGRVPEKVRADFPTVQLPHLWEEKKKRKGETPVVEQTKRALVSSYDQARAEKIGWREFRARGQSSVDTLRHSLDWRAIARHYKLSETDLRFVREFEGQIDGSALMSYALTELMPGTDGVLNREMFDFLLRIGGREYVERIPAVNDDKTSIGPYQFTEYALYDVGAEKRGASKVNQYLPKHLQIPGSVAKMQGDHHHKAAYLFAIDNLARLTRRLKDDDKAALLGRASELRPSIVEFVATAHNLPAVAMGNFANYLVAFLGRDPRPQPKPRKDKKGKEIESKPLPPIKLGPEADYLEHTSSGGLVRNYARKTRANYRTIVRS